MVNMLSSFAPSRLNSVNSAKYKEKHRILMLLSYLNIWSYYLVHLCTIFWSCATRRRSANESCSCEQNEAPVIIGEVVGDGEELVFMDAETWPWSFVDDDGMFTLLVVLAWVVTCV